MSVFLRVTRVCFSSNEGVCLKKNSGDDDDTRAVATIEIANRTSHSTFTSATTIHLVVVCVFVNVFRGVRSTRTRLLSFRSRIPAPFAGSHKQYTYIMLFGVHVLFGPCVVNVPFRCV